MKRTEELLYGLLFLHYENCWNNKQDQEDGPNFPSALRPVPHSDELPIPAPPKNWSLDSENLQVSLEKILV